MTLYPKQERRTKTFRITNDSFTRLILSFLKERRGKNQLGDTPRTKKISTKIFSSVDRLEKQICLSREPFPRPKFGGWVLRSSKTLEASLEEPSKREKENLLSMECKRPCIHPVAILFPSSWAELLDPGSILLPPPWIQLFDSEIIDFRSLAFDGQVSYFIVRGK